MTFEIKKVNQLNDVLIDKVFARHNWNEYVCEMYSREYVDKKIKQILKRGVCFELWEEDQPIAFISAYKLDELFYGQKGFYTPELGFFYENDWQVLNQLLQALYEDMRLEGYTHHAISLLNPSFEDPWFVMGYGLRTMDAVRRTAEVESEISLKAIEENDFEIFYPMYQEHQKYMMGSPIFLDGDTTETACMDSIKDRRNQLFFLMNQDTPIGFTTLNETDPAGSDLFKDQHTLAIKGTHILEGFQRQGFGQKSIDAIMAYASRKGFEKIATDFETLNQKAYRFWPRFFAIVAKSYVRYIG